MDIPQTTLDWLLEEENPSVRYRTLTELLDYSTSDLLVQQAKAKISTAAPVQRIFARMHPDGYWLCRGKGDNLDYAIPSSTHFIFSYLAELGMDRTDERIARAVERYLSLEPPDIPNPAFWQIPPDYRNHQSCLYAYNLRTFILFGYRDDPRIQTRIDVLLNDDRLDGGYLCDRPSFKPKTKSCIRGSLKALMAFAVLPELWASDRCRRLVDYFLRRRVFHRTKHPEEVIRPELTRAFYPFTITGSLLEPLYALSRMGYGNSPAMQPAWEMLDSKRDATGRYLLDAYPNTLFDPGPANKPNKWVTLYALFALKNRQASSQEGVAP